MNIEKIVLGVLDKIEVKNMWSKSYKEDIAKSVSNKIRAVSIDRDEVEKILSILLITLHEIDSGVCEQITGKPMDDYVLNRTNAINGAITQICNLPIEEGDE